MQIRRAVVVTYQSFAQLNFPPIDGISFKEKSMKVSHCSSFKISFLAELLAIFFRTTYSVSRLLKQHKKCKPLSKPYSFHAAPKTFCIHQRPVLTVSLPIHVSHIPIPSRLSPRTIIISQNNKQACKIFFSMPRKTKAKGPRLTARRCLQISRRLGSQGLPRRIKINRTVLDSRGWRRKNS